MSGRISAATSVHLSPSLATCAASSFSRERRLHFRARPPTACPGFHLALAGPTSTRAPSWGSHCPLARHQPAASTHTRNPNSALRSDLGVSHALVGFRHHRPCRLVSSRSHVQGSALQGVVHVAEPYRISPASCPRILRCVTPAVARASASSGDFRALLSAAEYSVIA
jgi:hypothetical protein